MHRVENDKLLTPFLRQEKNLKKYFKNTGFSMLDDLLIFLETNKSTYSLFAGYTKEFYINTAKEFSAIHDINESYYLFLKTRSFQRIVEDLSIIPSIGIELHTELKTAMKTGVLTADQTTLLQQIQTVVAHLTVYRGGYELLGQIIEKNVSNLGSAAGTGTNDDFQAVSLEYLNHVLAEKKVTGEIYLKSLVNYLRANADKFTTYKNSSAYTTENPKFTNRGKIVVMG